MGSILYVKQVVLLLPHTHINRMDPSNKSLQSPESTVSHGLALAVSGSNHHGILDTSNLRTELGKEWVDAYIAWNIAFVASSVSASISVKLFIPSVVCTASTDPGIFIQRRTISLALGLMHHFDVSTNGGNFGLDNDIIDVLIEDEFNQQSANLPLQRYSLAEALGSSNQMNIRLAVPMKDQVEQLLYSICREDCHEPSQSTSDTNPLSTLDHEDFTIYFGFVTWLTVIISGFALEMFAATTVLKKCWTDYTESLWRLSQMLFSIFAICTFGVSLYLTPLSINVVFIFSHNIILCSVLRPRAF